MTLRIVFLFLITSFIGCKSPKINAVIFEEKETVEIKANTACRNSSIIPLKNETELKNNILLHSTASLKKMKFKTSNKLIKSTHKISKIEFTITETCETKSDNNVPPIKLNEKLIIENLTTKEIVYFETDTIINQQALNNKQLATKEINFQPYILPLTQKNYIKAKEFFKRK